MERMLDAVPPGCAPTTTITSARVLLVPPEAPGRRGRGVATCRAAGCGYAVGGSSLCVGCRSSSRGVTTCRAAGCGYAVGGSSLCVGRRHRGRGVATRWAVGCGYVVGGSSLCVGRRHRGRGVTTRWAAGCGCAAGGSSMCVPPPASRSRGRDTLGSRVWIGRWWLFDVRPATGIGSSSRDKPSNLVSVRSLVAPRACAARARS